MITLDEGHNAYAHTMKPNSSRVEVSCENWVPDAGEEGVGEAGYLMLGRRGWGKLGT